MKSANEGEMRDGRAENEARSSFDSHIANSCCDSKQRHLDSNPGAVANFMLSVNLYVSIAKVDEVKINYNAVFSRHWLVGSNDF